MADTDYTDLLADQVVIEAVNDAAGYITATVVAVHDNATVDVRIGDSSDIDALSESDVLETGQVLTGLAYPAWMSPTVGLVVWLVQQGSWTTIVGSPAQGGQPPPLDVGGATIYLGNQDLPNWDQPHGLPTTPKPQTGALGVTGYANPVRDMLYRAMGAYVPVTSVNAWAKLAYDTLSFTVETYGVLRLGIHLSGITVSGGQVLIRPRVYNAESPGNEITPRSDSNYIRVSSTCSGSATWLAALREGKYRLELHGYVSGATVTASCNYLNVDFDFMPGAVFTDVTQTFSTLDEPPMPEEGM